MPDSVATADSPFSILKQSAIIKRAAERLEIRIRITGEDSYVL